MKCIGNCALCQLEVDKVACCQVQILKNVIEIKKIVRERKDIEDPFKGLEDIGSEETSDDGPAVSGTDGVGELIIGDN